MGAAPIVPANRITMCLVVAPAVSPAPSIGHAIVRAAGKRNSKPHCVRNDPSFSTLGVIVRYPQVEATKFTEVGFHGRDVDQIIRDLVDNSIVMMRQRMRKQLREQIERAVEDRLLVALVGEGGSEQTKEAFRDLLRWGWLGMDLQGGENCCGWELM